jgi:hypothetical protein
MQKDWKALAVICLFVLLGISYSIASPIFEMGDEIRHFSVIKFMQDNKRLPAQDDQQLMAYASHEMFQPPLYYAAAIALTSWIRTDSWESVFYFNPHTSIGIPLRHDNKNMAIHTEQEQFPWHGHVLAVHLIRFLSILFAAFGLFYFYRLALMVFRGDRNLSLLALALAAFTPSFIFLSATVNPDSLIIMLCAAGLWRILRLDAESLTAKEMLKLGVIIGLGTLTKMYAFGLLPLAALAIWLIDRWDWRKLAPHLATLGGSWLIVAGWWYVRNGLLYGDFSGLKPILSTLGRGAPYTVGTFFAEMQGVMISYWALFGGSNILVSEWIYQLLFIFGLICLAGFVLWLLRHGSPVRVDNKKLGMILAWLMIVAAGWIIWTIRREAANGKHFYPALISFAVLMTLGWASLIPARWRLRLLFLPAIGLFILAAAAPYAYIAPAYAKPPLMTVRDVPPDLPRLNWNIDGKMELLGARVLTPRVHAGEKISVQVFWQVLEPMEKDYSVFVHVFGRYGKKAGQFDTYPGNGAYPTSLLNKGDVIADTYEVSIDPAAEADGPARLRVLVGLYDYHEPGRPGKPAFTPQGKPVDNQIGSSRLIPWQEKHLTEATPANIKFGDSIELVGYRLSRNNAECAAEGTTTCLLLEWRAVNPPPADYNVFIQLWAGEKQLTGFDSPPLNGDYPTSIWEPNETVIDAHALDISQAAAGEYRLRLGLYNLASGERLPALQADGAPLRDYALDIPVVVP